MGREEEKKVEEKGEGAKNEGLKYHSAVASSCMRLCTSDTYNIGRGVWVELPAMSCEGGWEGCGWSYLQCLVSVHGRGVWVELPAMSCECVWEEGVGGATCNVL